MTPFQKIAIGMIVIVGRLTVAPDAGQPWRQYDLLADPIGWALVIAGLVAVTRSEPAFGTTRGLAILAGVVSVPLWVPQVTHALSGSGLWAASLPELACFFWLCRTSGRLAALATPRDAGFAKWFGLLSWGYVVIAVLPVLLLGGHLTVLAAITALAAFAVNIGATWTVYAAHRRPYLGGTVESG